MVKLGKVGLGKVSQPQTGTCRSPVGQGDRHPFKRLAGWLAGWLARDQIEVRLG